MTRRAWKVLTVSLAAFLLSSCCGGGSSEPSGTTGGGASPQPAQVAGGDATCAGATTLTVQSSNGAYDSSINWSSVRSAFVVKRFMAGQVQPGGLVVLSTADIPANIVDRRALKRHRLGAGQGAVHLDFFGDQPVTAGQSFDIGGTKRNIGFRPRIQVGSGAAVQFSTGSKGAVVITYWGADKVCGNVDLGDNWSQVKGRFVATWRN